ncbi:hypothetical protein HK097_009700 [Rhizophlyctis rosea]|uniref:BPP domain-containing protein n=1 Tax=Rhizophlyctis rosea TaxID=64517 RepID=A0AAD5X0X3_9FUNG|nr:hypothetical protein HK097_009700 [Rhizophlyctis rosea]
MRVASLLILSSLFLVQANPILRRQEEETPRIPPGVRVIPVYPTAETDPAGTDGDDPAIWVHPKSKGKSTIITTSKEDPIDDGLFVFNLEGKKLQYIRGGKPDNVDVIYKFGKKKIDLTVAACRTDNTICLHKINQNTGLLEPIAGGSQPTKPGFEVYGSCEYKSPKTGKQYIFINSKTSEYLQYELTQTTTGALKTTLVRSFFAGKGGQVEGCTVDRDNGYLLLGEEDYGLWRYPAEPSAPLKPYLIDSVNATAGGKLVPDVEGVSLFYGKKKDEGYIIVSVQGISAYNVYERKYPHKYIFTFGIRQKGYGGIDAVQETDGLAVISTKVNSKYPNGLLVVHDDNKTYKNGTVAEHTTFKMVSWEDIVKASGKKLKFNPSWDPRA